MAIIFISYAQYDKPLADALWEFFSVGDERPFMASQIRSGKPWRKEVKAQLRSASVVLAVMSIRSVRQPWVNFEAGAAWVAGKDLIPVCFGSMRKDQLPSHYAEWQAVNLPEELPRFCEDVVSYFPADKRGHADKISRRGNSRKRLGELTNLVDKHDRIIAPGTSPGDTVLRPLGTSPGRSYPATTSPGDSYPSGGTSPGDTYIIPTTSPGDSPYYPTVAESPARSKEPRKT
jgi:hypothetical protein